MQRLRTGLGLLDLLDEYWVTVELRNFVTEQADRVVTAAFWAGYRQRLEAVEPAEQVLYSLLDRLHLPADTPHLAPLRAVLVAGARNHYRHPHLWDTVRQERR
ncbi:hypothetical protein ACQPWR_30910 [Micromonospora vinacea]|uniref:hypothetical protein n=1 Tax=Micromonospora vinacea TaxID=709878 RepID=UPI003D8CEBD6